MKSYTEALLQSLERSSQRKAVTGYDMLERDPEGYQDPMEMEIPEYFYLRLHNQDGKEIGQIDGLCKISDVVEWLVSRLDEDSSE